LNWEGLVVGIPQEFVDIENGVYFGRCHTPYAALPFHEMPEISCGI
jgi:hypothetical protein